MKLIILDRDGVINYDSEHYIKSIDEWLPIPGSLEAIVKLKEKGYQIAIATNQSGIARGLYTLSDLDAIHTQMQNLLEELGGKIDLICYCPHHPDNHCQCRKPKPGMFEQIQKHFNCDLKNVPYVGDSISDVKVAQAAQCKPILVATGCGKETHVKLSSTMDINLYENLYDFVMHGL